MVEAVQEEEEEEVEVVVTVVDADDEEEEDFQLVTHEWWEVQMVGVLLYEVLKYYLLHL